MPGLYKTKSFVEVPDNKKLSYGFKNTDRENKATVYIGIQDKALFKSDISPIKYARSFEFDKRLPSTYVSALYFHSSLNYCIY